MARKVTPAQLRAELQRSQRQAISSLNTSIRTYNSAVDSYSAVRHTNARVRVNHDRLRRELARLNTSTRTTTQTTFRSSVVRVQEACVRGGRAATADGWVGSESLLNEIEGEAANGAASWNAPHDEYTASLPHTDDFGTIRIADELTSIDPDLDARWRGALFALNPANPAAARHFCRSSRELKDRILVRSARNDAVESQLADYEKTPNGAVACLACIRLCLVRSGRYPPEIDDLADADLENVIRRSAEFNGGAGSAGHVPIAQLASNKRRVEDAVLFLYEVER